MNFFSKFGSQSKQQQEAEESTSLLSEWKDYSGRDVEAGPSTSTSSSQGLKESVDRAKSKVSELFSSSYRAVANGVSSGVAALPTSDSFHIPSAQQFTMFGAFLAGGAVFLTLSFVLFLPVIILTPAKFALSFTLGCLCVMLAFSALRGWKAQLTHMVSLERLPFTAVYLASIIATLYVSLIMQSYLLSLLCSGVQVVALLYYTMSYFPGGTQGAKFMVQAVSSTVAGCFGRLFK